jgi:hypothetical protein
MNDLDLIKCLIEKRLNELQDYIINNGSGIEMGCSPDWIKKQFDYTKKCLFGKADTIKRFIKDE